MFFLREELDDSEIRRRILQADLVYVGGGNTQKMLQVRRRRGVDRVREEAWHQGIVLSGLSVGSICWFRHGHSDSIKFEQEEDWSYIRVDGLGLIDAFHCPHYNEPGRAADFEKMLVGYEGVGIGLEDSCALEVVNNTYRVLPCIDWIGIPIGRPSYSLPGRIM